MQKSALPIVCLLLLSIASFLPVHAQDTLVIRQENILPGVNFWRPNRIYLLDGDIKLESGLLQIQAGTQVVAKSKSSVTGQPSSLTIGPDARIVALGTAQAPIQFVTDQLPRFWSPDDPIPAWKGLRIQGGKNTNQLSFVSIAFAGAREGTETGAALFLENLSRQDQIDHVEVFSSHGDGIRIHGGDVSLLYTTVAFVQDDAYEWDYGWTGYGLYWLAYQLGIDFTGEERTDPSSGIEGHGNIGPNGRRSSPSVYNATVVGLACGSNGRIQGPSNQTLAVHLLNNTQGLIANSVFVDFPNNGIQVEDLRRGEDCRQQIENGKLHIADNVWYNFGTMSPQYGVGYLETKTGFSVGEDGFIQTAEEAEDPRARYLEHYLTDNGNVYSPRGLGANRRELSCLTFDPRPHFNSPYDRIPNTPYPTTDFFLQNVLDPGQKGAFSRISIWIEGWTRMDEKAYLGEEAVEKYFYKDQRLFNNDTLKLNCEEFTDFLDNIGYEELPCYPQLDIVVSASRRGNQRRRPSKTIITENPVQPAFIRDVELSPHYPYGCTLLDTLKVTLLIYDETPPVIYPVPGPDGSLSAVVEDCDETTLTIQIDTISINGGIRIQYAMVAEDFVGNESSLLVSRELTNNRRLVYADMDGDGFGNPELPLESSNIPFGFVDNDLDCNDSDPNAYPRSTAEAIDQNDRDGVDLDCSGQPNYDICRGAVTLPLDSFCTFRFFAFAASNPSVYPAISLECGDPANLRDVWARVTTPESGRLYFTVGDPDFRGYPIKVELYSGDCQQLTLERCVGQGVYITEEINELSTNTEYFLRFISIVNAEENTFSICIRDPAIFADNISCERGQVVRFNRNNRFTGIFNSLGVPSTGSFGDFDCGGSYRKRVWFELPPLETFDSLHFTVQNLTNEVFAGPQLRLYRGKCDRLEQVACGAFESPDLLRFSAGGFQKEDTYFAEVILSDETVFRLEIQAEEAAVTTNILDLIPDASWLQIHPNPIRSGELSFILNISRSTYLQGTLIDVSGKQIGQVIEAGSYQGRHSIKMPPSVAPGLYFLRLQTEYGLFNKKLVVIQ